MSFKPRPANPVFKTEAPPQGHGGRRRSKPLVVTSNVQLSNEIYPWERELLAPVIVPIVEKVLHEADAKQASKSSGDDD